MNKPLYIVKSVIATLVVITLFACEGNYKNVQKLNTSDGAPFAIGKNINLKYTDSGKVMTNLLAPILEDYSTKEFPYQEFPEGVEVHFWDEEGKESVVTSNYAIRYDLTGIVDLRDQVVVTTADGIVLEATQLYWDQTNEWVFTDQPYKMKQKDGSFNNGAGFDSNQKFTKFLSRSNQGVQVIESKEETTTNNEEPTL